MNFFKINKFTLVIFLLNLIGLITLYSATHGTVRQHSYNLFWQQLVWSGVAWVVFFITTTISYKTFKRLAYIIYGLNITALLGVMFFGKTILGAKRWIDLKFFNFQPSETIKISIVLILSSYFCKRNFTHGMGLKDLVFPAVITLIPFVLTVQQPDLGTSLLIAAVSLSMLLFVRIKLSIILFALLFGFVATPLVWNFGLKSYQKERIFTFLSPMSDPRGSGYNSIQSKIAVGSGQFTGKGFLKGTQSQLDFIPERHSDFIYSVLSEEYGFIGSFFTFALFIILFHMMLKISMESKDKFSALMVFGLSTIIFYHVLINVGMVMGLLPIVGLPLPLLSKGGSSLIATFFSLGLISSVSSRKYLF